MQPVYDQTWELYHPTIPPGTGGIGASDGKIKISGADTTSAFAEAKITPGEGLIATKVNPGSNEVLSLGLYTIPVISYTGGSNNEIGSTVANVSLSWTSNVNLMSMNLSAPVPIGDRTQGSGLSGSYTHIGANLTIDTSYHLTINDGKGSYIYNTNVNFYNRLYYGANINTSLSNSDVLSLNKEFIINKETQKTINCSGGKYIWICYPASFGSSIFLIDGFVTTFTFTSQDVTNDSGHLETYYLYRSNFIQNGTDISVEVI